MMRVGRNSTSSGTAAATGTFELMLEEEACAPKAFNGYNPYETLPGMRRGGPSPRQADLRRLSDWIRLKRQVTAIKSAERDKD